METGLWKRTLAPYELAVEELTTKFRHVIREYHIRNEYSPIERVTGRVKSVSSILDKMQRKNIPMEQMEEKIDDIAGIRIICQFEEDIYKVSSLISRRSDMVVKEKKDYLTHVKESGYRSYHVVVYYVVETLKGPKQIMAEIQIRTMAMNFWATIEHSLQYKYRGEIPPNVTQRLSAASRTIIDLDSEMSSVRDVIIDAQNSSLLQNNLVRDILMTIENLYKVTTEREVKKIQDEFLRIFNMHDLDELERFHRELDIIAEGYRVQQI